MRISDWSSDVCSSDLLGDARILHLHQFGYAVPVVDHALAPDLGGMGCKNGNDERLVEQLHDLIDTNIMTLQALERCTHIGSWLCCNRSEEHTSELQSLMRISYAVFCLKKNKIT